MMSQKNQKTKLEGQYRPIYIHQRQIQWHRDNLLEDCAGKKDTHKQNKWILIHTLIYKQKLFQMDHLPKCKT